jgi:hypothetical protein
MSRKLGKQLGRPFVENRRSLARPETIAAAKCRGGAFACPQSGKSLIFTPVRNFIRAILADIKAESSISAENGDAWD